MMYTIRKSLMFPAERFAVIIVVCMVVSSLPEHRCPSPRPPSCNCSNTLYGYELRCLAFTVQVKPQAAVYIHCNTYDVSDFAVLNGMRIGEVERFIMWQCPLPSLSLSEVMENIGVSKHVSNVHTPKLQMLELESKTLAYLESGVFQNLTHLRLLILWGNLRDLSRAVFYDLKHLESLTISLSNMTSLSADLFVDLIKLRKINLYANKFINLPNNLFINNQNLRVISLQDNRYKLNTLPSRFLAQLTKLKEVKIQRCNLSTLPDDLLWGSTSITIISLNNNDFTTLPELLFIHCRELHSLDISFNQIMHLPSTLFFSVINLKFLKINNNQLTHTSVDLFYNQHKLEVLDLKDNRLSLVPFFNTTSSLKAVNMSNNMLTSEKFPLLSALLEDIQLANNSLTKLLSVWQNLENLETLNLAHNKISYIRASELHFTGTKNIFVNVSYNNISEIDIFETETVYKYDSQFKIHDVPMRNFSIEGNPIDCDCKVHSLLQYIKDELAAEVNFIIETKPRNLKRVKLEAYIGYLVGKVPINLFTCLLEKENLKCPKQCSCLLRTADKVLLIDCHQGNLMSMPDALPDIKFSKYTELNLSGNKIKTIKWPLGPGYNKVEKYILSNNTISEIDLSAFSRKLQVLQVNGNHINQFNKSSITFLIDAIYLTQLTLHNNPWSCDCTTKHFVTVIQSNHNLKKINPLENVTCENGKEILKVSDTELCPAEQKIVVNESYKIAALAILFGFLFVLYYKFQKGITVWLYAHRCCMWFVTEDEIDQDKLYDVFVSYAHQDEDFVMDHLVPGLESYQYTLCLHQRDWMPGEFIPSQIANSVESSRRTIIVLSPAFLNSAWGRMEFCAAHKQALSERRIRVIVLLYGDIVSTEIIDSDMRAYLSMNTYIKWGDLWFWDKLRYAMPHTKKLRNGIPLQARA